MLLVSLNKEITKSFSYNKQCVKTEHKIVASQVYENEGLSTSKRRKEFS